MSCQPLHVVMTTNAIIPDKLGGLERYVRELAAALVRPSVRVTVLTKQTEPAQRLASVLCPPPLLFA